MTIYSLDVLHFLFGTSLLSHVQFWLLLPDLHTDFSRGRSGGLVFPSLSDFPQIAIIHTVKGFGIVNKAEINAFLELSCFFSDPADVGNLISGSSAFNPAWTSGSSRIVEAWLGEFWALLHYCVRWVQLCGSLSILWHCLSLGLEWKLTLCSPVATAEFSKFAGILSAALSQHHLLRYEIAQLQFYHFH